MSRKLLQDTTSWSGLSDVPEIRAALRICAGRYHIEVDLFGRSYEPGAPFYSKVVPPP